MKQTPAWLPGLLLSFAFEPWYNYLILSLLPFLPVYHQSKSSSFSSRANVFRLAVIRTPWNVANKYLSRSLYKKNSKPVCQWWSHKSFVNTTTTWHATSLVFPCVESKLGRGVHPLPAVVQRMTTGVCNKTRYSFILGNLEFERGFYLPRNMNPFTSPSIQVQVPTLPTWFNKSMHGHHHLIINLHWTHCSSHRSSWVHGDLRYTCSFWGEAELGPPWVFAGNLVSMLWQMFVVFFLGGPWLWRNGRNHLVFCRSLWNWSI